MKDIVMKLDSPGPVAALRRRDKSARTSASPWAVPVALGLPVVAWQTIFFALPMLFLVVITFWRVRSFRLAPAFVFDNWKRVLASTSFHRALDHTLAVAGTTTVLTLCIAFPVAYTIAFRLPARVRALAIVMLTVPVFSSYILRIYAWQIVLSPNGLINSIVQAVGGSSLPLLGGSFSLQIGLLTLALPVAVLILTFAMSGVESTLFEAAANLGCRRARVIAFVLVPAVRPAILMAATTTFLLAFGDYVSPLFMMGSNPPTLSILIVDTVKSGSEWPRTSVIGVTMLVVLGLVFGLGKLASKRSSSARSRA